jgi:hypothetical protein
MKPQLRLALFGHWLIFVAGPPGLTQDIRCTDRACRGTDIMGNKVLLRVDSDRTDRTQRYTARIGEEEIQIEQTRSPVVSGGWNGPALLQRRTTEITGEVNGYPVKLHSNSSGLVSGTAFGERVNCAVDGWSVLSPSPCF